MKQFWKLLLRNPGGLIGLVILTVAILIALFGPWVFPNSPWRMVQRPFWLRQLTLSMLPNRLSSRAFPSLATCLEIY